MNNHYPYKNGGVQRQLYLLRQVINVIDHLLFNKQKYIPETADVKQKLDNYDYLKKFHDRVMTFNDKRFETGGYTGVDGHFITEYSTINVDNAGTITVNGSGTIN